VFILLRGIQILKIDLKNIYKLYVVSIDIQVFSWSYTHGYSETRQRTWGLLVILIPVNGCQSTIRSDDSLHMILQKGCLDMTRLWGDVDFCNRFVGEVMMCTFVWWHLPLSCLPQHKIGWVPQGTEWGCHSIWTWTGRGNSGDQLQQTRQNRDPAGWKFPRHSTSTSDRHLHCEMGWGVGNRAH